MIDKIKDPRFVKCIHYGILLVLVYFVVFVRLGSFHMRVWDESLFAVNTYEMMQNGNFFTLFYDGVPDLYNTKPPLTSWLQLFFVKIFGYNELAIRMPSAMAAALSVVALFRFLEKHFDYVWAWLAALILLTSAGFIGYHTARTGDSDAVLSLFLLLANLVFIEYLLEEKGKYILLMFLFITLAFATKSYAALLFTPAYLFLLIYYKKLNAFLFNWRFLAGLIFFLFFIISLFLFRELDAPGYLKTIWSNDAGRLFEVPAGFENSFLYYLENFFRKRLSNYYLLVVLGAVCLFFYKKKKTINQILIPVFVLVFTYLLIISISITKLFWYDMPLYPLLAVLAAYPFVMLINVGMTKVRLRKVGWGYGLIAILFVYPYTNSFWKSQTNSMTATDFTYEASSYYLHSAIKKGDDLNGVKVFYRSFDGSLLFYKYKLQESNQIISLHKTVADLSVGDLVLAGKKELIRELKGAFDLVEVNHYGNAILFSLH